MARKQLWELVGYNTDWNYDDIRFRSYTTSERAAEAFKKIPKIQFSNSGHGIVFTARLVARRNEPLINIVADHVYKHWHMPYRGTSNA